MKLKTVRGVIKEHIDFLIERNSGSEGTWCKYVVKEARLLNKETVTFDDIEKITGLNPKYLAHCDGCGENGVDTVEIRTPNDDDEFSPERFCKPCLEKAFALFSQPPTE